MMSHPTPPSESALPTDLAALEERAFRRVHHNGLADLFGGLSLLLFGATALTELDLLPLGVVVLWPFWEMAKRIWVVPRVGRVRYGPSREQWLRQRLWILLGANLVVLVFGISAWLSLRGEGRVADFFREYRGIPLAFAFGGLLVVIGRVYAARRAYLYSAVLIALAVAGHLAGVDLGWVIVAAGAFICLGGGVILAAFLRRYPHPGGHDPSQS